MRTVASSCDVDHCCSNPPDVQLDVQLESDDHDAPFVKMSAVGAVALEELSDNDELRILANEEKIDATPRGDIENGAQHFNATFANNDRISDTFHHAAATIIQKRHRGYMSRKRIAAATIIQGGCRGYTTRKRVAAVKKAEREQKMPAERCRDIEKNAKAMSKAIASQKHGRTYEIGHCTPSWLLWCVDMILHGGSVIKSDTVCSVNIHGLMVGTAHPSPCLQPLHTSLPFVL